MASVITRDIGVFILFVTQKDRAASHNHCPQYCTDIVTVPPDKQNIPQGYASSAGVAHLRLDWRYSLITEPLGHGNANRIWI